MRADVEKLKAARELLARPNGWTTEAAARDATGRAVFTDSASAVCFCAYGAMWAVGVPASDITPEELLLEQAIDGEMIAAWNDTTGRTQAEVVAAFDRAIALAEAAP